MSALLYAVSIWMFGFGLWTHDWRVLVASGAIAIIWPLIGDEVYMREQRRRHERELDKLWDDDDLSESA